MKKRKGFTLVELLVVIAILAVLASVSVIGYLGFTEKARRSNDEQLVANINSVLMADEVFTNSPVAAIDIVENLEQKGFKLETQSKDVDLFYNTDKGRVELASIDKEGNYQTVYPEVKKSTAVKAKINGVEENKVLSTTNSLENFVPGYVLVGQKSQTGISTLISDIRNAESTLDQANALAELKEKNRPVGEVVDSYVGNAAFIGKNNQFIKGTTLSGKTYLTFSKYATELTVYVLDDILGDVSSINIIDIPRKVSIDATAEDKLYNLIRYGNGSDDDVVVVASTEFISSLNNAPLKEEITSQADREEKLSKVNVIQKDSTGKTIANKGQFEFTKTMRVNGAAYFAVNAQPKNDQNKYNYYDVVLAELVSDKGARKNVSFKLINETYRLPITKTEEEFKNQDGTYTLEITYQEKADAKARVSDEKGNENYGFKTINEALLYTASSSAKETIRVIADDRISEKVTVGAADTLIVEKKIDDDGKLFTKKNASKGKVFRTLNLANSVTNKGKIIVSGGQNYATGGNFSGEIAGDYAVLNLEQGGSIQNTENAVLEAWGIINSKDPNAGTQIVMNDSSVLNARAVANFQGGSLSSTSNNNNIFPFIDYAVDGITGNYSFTGLSKLNLNFGVFVKVLFDIQIESLFPIISHDDNSLFKMSGGTINLSIDSKRKIKVDLYGRLALNKLYINLAGFGGVGVVDTDKMVLPINGNFDINIHEGAILDINAKQGIKLLPGAKMHVHDGGRLYLNNSALYVYEWSEGAQADPGSDPHGFYSGYSFSDKYNNSNFPSSASFINEGTLHTVGTNRLSGKFEGSGEYFLNENTIFNEKISELNYRTKKPIQTFLTKDGTTSVQGTIR